MDAETFFTEQEKGQIAAAIEAVEKETAGEVAVMVVDQSDSYLEVFLLYGIILGAMIALVLPICCSSNRCGLLYCFSRPVRARLELADQSNSWPEKVSPPNRPD